MGKTLAAIEISQRLTALDVCGNIFGIAGLYDACWFDDCEVYYLRRIGRIAISTALDDRYRPPLACIGRIKKEVVGSLHNAVDLAAILTN